MPNGDLFWYMNRHHRLRQEYVCKAEGEKLHVRVKGQWICSLEMSGHQFICPFTCLSIVVLISNFHLYISLSVPIYPTSSFIQPTIYKNFYHSIDLYISIWLAR